MVEGYHCGGMGEGGKIGPEEEARFDPTPDIRGYALDGAIYAYGMQRRSLDGRSTSIYRRRPTYILSPPRSRLNRGGTIDRRKINRITHFVNNVQCVYCDRDLTQTGIIVNVFWMRRYNNPYNKLCAMPILLNVLYHIMRPHVNI